MEVGMVVIGASLGGLEAIQTLLAGLHAGFKAPVAIVLHRAVESGPMLRAILQRSCALPVREPHDKEAAVPGTVYLAPTDYHTLVEDGQFSLSTEGPVTYARPSIDVLFESAADDYGAATVAVILTGSNRDGSAGVAHIKECGGVVIVQNPQTAESPQMPAAALQATSPDYVVDIEDISLVLNRLVGANALEVA